MNDLFNDEIEDALAAVESPFTHIGDIKANMHTRPLKSGFRELEKFEILRAGEPDLVILGARPGNGKTAFLVQTLKYVAQHEGTAIMFSLEMSKEQLKRRILADESNTDIKKLQHLSDDRIGIVDKRLHDTTPFLVDDTKGLDINNLRARVLAYRKKHPIAIVGVDYLQIVRTSTGRSKREEILEVTEGLKQLANDVGCPVLAVAQMSREIEKRQQMSRGAKPVMSDLQECGGIENWADQIAFLDAAWRRDPARAGEVDFFVEKNRHGNTGRFVLLFEGAQTRFKDFEGGL